MTHDMTTAIQPKSDQQNADDFVAGPRTIRITEVRIAPNTEQPISVFFEGDQGKPWKPCKTTARLMVAAWGKDAKEYTGRSLTLYRDPEVKWAGMAVGGIRISHMSHIDSDMVYAATVTKGKRAPIRVKPLKAEIAPLKVVAPAEDDAPPFDVAEFENIVTLALVNFEDADTLETWWAEQKPLRLQARAADKERAGVIATKVAEHIATLKGDC